MDPKPVRVTVESLDDHDYAGVDRPTGTVYEAEEPFAGLLVSLGTVRPVPVARVNATPVLKALKRR